MLHYKHISTLTPAQIAEILIAYRGSLKSYLDENGSRRSYLDLVRSAGDIDWVSLVKYYGRYALELAKPNVHHIISRVLSGEYSDKRATVLSILSSVEISLSQAIQLFEYDESLISVCPIVDSVRAQADGTFTDEDRRGLANIRIALNLTVPDLERACYGADQNSPEVKTLQKYIEFKMWYRTRDPNAEFVNQNHDFFARAFVENVCLRFSLGHVINSAIVFKALQLDVGTGVMLYERCKDFKLPDDVDYDYVLALAKQGNNWQRTQLLKMIFAGRSEKNVLADFPPQAIPLYVFLKEPR